MCGEFGEKAERMWRKSGECVEDVERMGGETMRREKYLQPGWCRGHQQHFPVGRPLHIRRILGVLTADLFHRHQVPHLVGAANIAVAVEDEQVSEGIVQEPVAILRACDFNRKTKVKKNNSHTWTVRVSTLLVKQHRSKKEKSHRLKI